MKVFTACKLTHTLQTYLGMVVGNGRPQRRSYPYIPSHLLHREKVETQESSSVCGEALVLLFTSCVLEFLLARFTNRYCISQVERVNANIHACCNYEVDIRFMEMNITSLQRLDLEQAAAVVISVVRNDRRIENRFETVRALLNEIDANVFSRSCMWLEKSQSSSRMADNECKFFDLVVFVECVTRNKYSVEMSDIDDWSSLLPFLIRIRRCSPPSRCLFIPEWIFREANATPPPKFCTWDRQGRMPAGQGPSLPPTTDSIILTRSEYRRIQRRLLRYFRFWDPTIALRKNIKDLEANAIQGAQLIRSRVLPSNDTLVVAHYFFALQRRLQRKVVSTLHGTSFLAKGESGTIMQNNPEIPTSFEERLSAFSREKGIPISEEPLLPQIDQCCLLMESYVHIYGNGDRNNLVFKRDVSGGSGRGPVDEYNLLCDVLNTMCGKAKELGLEMPGPVRKFLAKDIMAWNGAWGDDAFTGRGGAGVGELVGGKERKGDCGGDGSDDNKMMVWGRVLKGEGEEDEETEEIFTLTFHRTDFLRVVSKGMYKSRSSIRNSPSLPYFNK